MIRPDEWARGNGAVSDFKGRDFEGEIVRLAVRWYCREPLRVCQRPHSLRGWSRDDESNNEQVFARGARARAVRMMLEHVDVYSSRWAAVESIAAKIGCAAQPLHEWTKKAEVDGRKRAGAPSDMAEKLRALERENCELRQANGIRRKASAYFA